MTWVYYQRTGALFHNGAHVDNGYSGIDNGKNNPGMQYQADVGPIPRGTYSIEAPFHHPHAGAYTMRLVPTRNTSTFGRTGLMIHGDSIKHPGRASTECIILPLPTRQRIWNSGDHIVEVVL